MSLLERISSVALTSTMRFRARGSAVTVYRGTRVRTRGKIVVDGSLELGSRWGSSSFFSPGHLIVAEGGCVRVAGSFDIHTGLRVVVDPGAVLTLGSGYINDGARIACFSSIVIGHDVAISEGVTIRDSDNHVLTSSSRPSTAPVVIGDHVWIGLGVTILKGVTIGDGAVVAAGAVVTRDVPARTLAAGVPATVRRRDVDWT
jgi:carbonic anhydrase/acetyltransferase-like protein (isoleucine patch superfamily)